MRDLLEGFSDDYRYKKCSKFRVGNILSELFEKHGIKKQDCKTIMNKNKICSEWNIYLPCGYTGVEGELAKLKPDNEFQIIFGIKGCDLIVSKDNLWKIISRAYGREGAEKLVPKTFLTNNQEDLKIFKQTYNPSKSYILKKNLQRQTGLKLSNNLNKILNLIRIDPNYRVIQELLQNPFLVNGHKINLRVYVLVVCFKGEVRLYRHEEGFLYYTPKPYKNDPLSEEVNITSGYVPREVYKKNPLTHSDFKQFLRREGKDPNVLFQSLDNVLAEIFGASSKYLCKSTNLQNNVSFQLFGVDIAPDLNLDCKLIEINKGPDMDAKDGRDKLVKEQVQEDIFNLLGIFDIGESRRNGFKLIKYEDKTSH